LYLFNLFNLSHEKIINVSQRIDECKIERSIKINKIYVHENFNKQLEMDINCYISD